MLQKGDSLLLAISGGPDSLSMFYIFKELKNEYKLNLGIAHFHHGIREEADEDLEFVRRLADEGKFPFYWAKEDIPKIASEKGLSLEEAAREERYKFLVNVAKSNNYNKIAVGHNKDDQIETFLHRLIRGAGLKGLTGIPPLGEREGIVIIRPLIECSREEIESYIKVLGVKPRIDRSNFDLGFTRNKIRHQLIPYLMKEFNPNVKEVLFNTVENISLAYSFVEEQTWEGFKRCMKKGPSCVMIKRKRFRRIHPYLKRELIRRAIEEVKGDLRRFEYAHWKEIEELIYNRPEGSIVDLPKGISIKKEKEYFLVYRREEDGREEKS